MRPATGAVRRLPGWLDKPEGTPRQPGPIAPGQRRPVDLGRMVRSLVSYSHLSLPGVAIIFNLWVLRAEPVTTSNFNDSSLHFTMLGWARYQVEQGRVPLDGWYPYVGLGLPQFHHYQSLPHLISAYISLVVGTDATYFWSLYLLLAFWPISVYLGARLLGWGRWTAAGAALVAPLLVSVTSYGYEHTSYMWWGLGMWTQLWGMWLLPLAWGLSWRAISGRGSYALGALAVALTIACHFLTGYLALLMIVIWVVIKPSELFVRLLRGAVVGGGAALIASWVIVPLLSDSRWQLATQYQQGTFWDDSFGAPKVLGWLFTGQIYDAGRLPVVTVLMAVGLAVCAFRFRKDERGRALLGAWVLSLLLFFGRPTLGSALKVLPGSDDLLFHRFLMGVHLAGLILAGVGASWLASLVIQESRRRLPRVLSVVAAAGVACIGVVVLLPAWTQVATYDAQTSTPRHEQQVADATDGADLQVLIDRVRALGGGRVYAGSAGNWGGQYAIGYVPVYNVLENQGIDAIGFNLRTSSLMSDDEVQFDERNPAQYDLFNIKYLILPADRPPVVPAKLLGSQGRHTLWQVQTSGYLEVVDTVAPPIIANRRNIGNQTAAFLNSSQLAKHQYSTVAFAGDPAAQPSLTFAPVTPSEAGTVESQSSRPVDGSFRGIIDANRQAVVLLKATYDPRWQLTVDGANVKTQMIAPALVGGLVPPGRHSILFQYARYPYYPQLLVLGLITLLGLGFGPGLLRRRRIFLSIAPPMPSLAPVRHWLAPVRHWLAPVRDSLGPLGQFLRSLLLRARASLLRRARSLSPTGWVALSVCAVVAAAAVGLLQVLGRGPLEWDESVRVNSGWWFGYWLSSGDLASVWQWLNGQTLYPFLSPTLYGLLLFAGASPILAAALPSLIAYGVAGVLAGRLAWEVGGGRLGAWAAALLFWLTPLQARLAAGAFTEPLGAAGELGLLALLLHLRRHPRLRTALWCSAVAGALLFLKWDYGILGIAMIGITGFLVTEKKNAYAVRRMYDIALVGALVVTGAFLAVNTHAKLAGLMTFATVDNPGGPSGIDLTFLPRALLTDPQVGLSPVTAVAMLVGLAWAVLAWRNVRAVRPLLVFVALSFFAYSSAIYREPRYFAPTIAILTSLAGAGFGQWLPAIAAWVGTGGRRVAVMAAAALGAVLILVAQLPGLAVQDFRIQPSPAAEQAGQFALSHLGDGSQPVLLLGPTTELSPSAIQLSWEEQTGQPAPLVSYVVEAAPAYRRATFNNSLLALMPGHVLAVEVGPGSELDTKDYRDFWPGQHDYISYATSLESAGCLRRVDQQELDGGRIHLIAWDVTGTPATFSACVNGSG